jgi:vancomycin resistance protein VanJ
MSDQTSAQENQDTPNETESPSKWRRFLSISRRFWLGVSVLAWFLGTVLQVIVRDRFAFSAPVFYALPWPIVIGFGSVGILCLRTNLAWLKRIFLVVVVVQAGCWIHGSFSFAQPASSEPRMRFMFWNICRGLLGYENVAREINESKAEVVALVEATYDAQSVDFWKTHCPDYSPYRLGSGMLILVKGRVTTWDHGNVKDVTRYRHIDINVRGKDFGLILMDVVSDPLTIRRPAMERLEQIAKQHRTKPLLVAGDFNTPPESVYFDNLRVELDKAFDVCGEGYRETWPVLAPVLDLDQVWGNDLIQWQRCWRGWSTYSDHRPVFVEFNVP